MHPSCCIAALICATAIPAASAQVADAPGHAPVDIAQLPGVFRMRLGDFTITALSDGTIPQDLHTIVTGASRGEIDALLRRSFLASPIEASVNVYVVDTGSRVILVDAGAGGLIGPGLGGKLLANLAAAGYRPEAIDDVLITHFHTDHLGGLTHGARLAFPNAVVHAAQAEFDFFLDPANAGMLGPDKRVLFDQAQATVGRYRRAGKVRGFSGNTQLYPGITAIPTPGHTPGHSFYRATSRGQSIEFWGDAMHFGALQFPRPEITVTHDADSAAAAAQRARQFASAAVERRLIGVAHLNFPGIGNIRAEASGGYGWVPVEYRDRTVRPPRATPR